MCELSHWMEFHLRNSPLLVHPQIHTLWATCTFCSAVKGSHSKQTPFPIFLPQVFLQRCGNTKAALNCRGQQLSDQLVSQPHGQIRLLGTELLSNRTWKDPPAPLSP